MHDELTAKRAEIASTFNRRTFLQFAALATAASPSAAVAAGSSLWTPDLSQPSDQEQVDACIAQLKEILGRMRPKVVEQSHFLQMNCDGSFTLTLQSRVEKIEFTGDGFYHISMGGYPMLFHVRKVPVSTVGGRYLYDTFSCQQWREGKVEDRARQFSDPYFIRKLEAPIDV